MLREARQGRHEALCVGMLRRGEDLFGRPTLYDLAFVQNRDALADSCN